MLGQVACVPRAPWRLSWRVTLSVRPTTSVQSSDSRGLKGLRDSELGVSGLGQQGRPSELSGVQVACSRIPLRKASRYRGAVSKQPKQETW